jgi:predicted restriction endonuclease
MVKDEDTYPENTVVRLKETGQFAIIRKKDFLKDGKNFLNYRCEIEGRKGLYAVYHHEIDLECLPPKDSSC